MGALHGMLNAEALAAILNDLFGGVVYAGIDTDKHKYPIGACPTSVGRLGGPGDADEDWDSSPWEWGGGDPGLQIGTHQQHSTRF